MRLADLVSPFGMVLIPARRQDERALGRAALFPKEVPYGILKQRPKRRFKCECSGRTFKPSRAPSKVSCPTGKLNLRGQIEAERQGGLLGEEQVPGTLEALDEVGRCRR